MKFGSVSGADCLFVLWPSVIPDAKQGREKEPGGTEQDKCQPVLFTVEKYSQ